MPKCGAYDKFLSKVDSIRCNCSAAFHKACVGIPETSSVNGAWVCPGCKIKKPGEDNTSTLVKGLANTYQSNPNSTNNSADNTTEELKVDLVLEIRSELKAIREEVHECRLEISEFKATLSAFEIRMREIETRISALKNKNSQIASSSNTSALQDTITELKVQLNNRDQELLSNDVEISSITELGGENLMSTVTVLSTKLGITLDKRDIFNVERVGLARRNRVEGSTCDDDLSSMRPHIIIAVRFTRRATRGEWLCAARVRRNLSTKDIDVTGKPSSIYINERLTHTLFPCTSRGQKTRLEICLVER
ncbi:unnamed protein product [Parnassius apollo]|uniref:(apollo) hypothetical protein n=1 Tax=Parnassius apollo TaxID=110799 RepID=A0A8S3WNE0_PARAO|nr:unnamed protein product [Parnassius apollo]